jgi:hypothetical protein
VSQQNPQSPAAPAGPGSAEAGATGPEVPVAATPAQAGGGSAAQASGTTTAQANGGSAAQVNGGGTAEAADGATDTAAVPAAPVAASPVATLPGAREAVTPPAPARGTGSRPWLLHLVVLAVYLAAGIAVTWPRAAYLAGRLPPGPDQAEYVWNMWWVAHQVVHLGNPWFTGTLAAPVGVQLGFDTLTPLLGLVMTPVTLLFGPSASYNLLAIVMPGLACYAMWRAARLWVRSQAGAIAAGAFFGLSGMFAFQDWYHLHTAAGCVFLPLALETAVLLRRDPGIRRGVLLGLVLGASMLVDQELSVLAVILAIIVLIPWLVRRPGATGYQATAVAAVTGAVIASPQLLTMAQTLALGHSNPAAGQYAKFAGELPGLFAPSPRLANYGLTSIASLYHAHTPDEALATFGLVLTVLAAFGLAVSWQRRSARALGLLWLGCAALALGPTLYLGNRQFIPLAQTWRGQQMSLLMPDTWLIRLPGLSSFREPDRLALLGLVGAVLLAGAAVDWLVRRNRPVLIAVALLAALEAGWPGPPGSMPTALPAVDRPIAADHSSSIVVDVPFGIRGIPWYGKAISPLALVLATADGHPRADSYTSWVPRPTLRGIRSHAFYTGLAAARVGKPISAAQLAAARQDGAALHIGWLLVWTKHWMAPNRPQHHHLHYGAIYRYLAATGFRLDYQADGVKVYRPL